MGNVTLAPVGKVAVDNGQLRCCLDSREKRLVLTIRSISEERRQGLHQHLFKSLRIDGTDRGANLSLGLGRESQSGGEERHIGERAVNCSCKSELRLGSSQVLPERGPSIILGAVIRSAKHEEGLFRALGERGLDVSTV